MMDTTCRLIIIDVDLIISERFMYGKVCGKQFKKQKYSVGDKVAVLLVLFTSMAIEASGQAQGVLSGAIIDASTNEGLPGASIVIGDLHDSTRVGISVSKVNGTFQIKLPTKDSLFMEVSFIGYRSFATIVYLDKEEYTFPDIRMYEEPTELENIEIKAKRPPVVIRGDTIEYHVPAYQYRPYVAIKELMSYIPGLDIDDNGVVRHNGKIISKILVNGREYFGSDGHVALNTLPVDVIDKIQLMPAQTDRIKGEEKDEMMMNLKIKEKVNFFGNVAAGAGTNNTYDLSGKIDKIDDNYSLSVLGSLNNINRSSGFLSPAVLQMFSNMTGESGLLSAGGGITRTLSSGLNYSNNSAGKVKLTGSYKFKYPQNYRENTQKRTQFIIPDSSFIVNSNTMTETDDINHEVNLRAGITIDSTNTLGVSFSGITYRSGRAHATEGAQTLDGDGELVNDIKRKKTEESSAINLPYQLLWSRTKGDARLSVGLSGSIHNSKTNNFNQSFITYYEETQDSTVQLNQQVKSDESGYDTNLLLYYFFEIDSNFSIAIQNGTVYSRTVSNRQAWNLGAQQEIVSTDTLLSNNFTSESVANYGDVTTFYNKGKLKSSAGVSFIYNKLLQYNGSTGRIFSQETLNASPVVTLGYDFASQKGLLFKYRVKTRQPRTQQLQPVPDNTNPLMVREGNPNLSSEFHQQLGLSYDNASASKSFNCHLSINSVNNKIISKTIIDDLGRQVSTYANVDGIVDATYDMKGSWKIYKFDITIGSGSNYRLDKSFINQTLINTKNISVHSSIGVGLRRQRLMLNVAYKPNYSIVKYENSTRNNQEYVTHQAGGKINILPSEKLSFSNEVTFSYNKSLPAELGKSSFLWNIEASYLLLKQAEIKFNVYDLFKENRNTNRTTNENYIVDTQTNNLQRFFMVGLKYHLR